MKESEAKRLKRMRINEVRRLRCRGQSQQEIAVKLGISEATISRDVHTIEQEYISDNKAYGKKLLMRHERACDGIMEGIKALWVLYDETKAVEHKSYIMGQVLDGWGKLESITGNGRIARDTMIREDIEDKARQAMKEVSAKTDELDKKADRLLREIEDAGISNGTVSDPK